MKTTVKEQYDFGSRAIYQIPFETIEIEKRFSGFQAQQFIVPWQLEQNQEMEAKREMEVD